VALPACGSWQQSRSQDLRAAGSAQRCRFSLSAWGVHGARGRVPVGWIEPVHCSTRPALSRSGGIRMCGPHMSAGSMLAEGSVVERDLRKRGGESAPMRRSCLNPGIAEGGDAMGGEAAHQTSDR